MGFDFVWHEKVRADVRPLTKEISSLIVDRVKNRLAQDPVGLSKPLKGVFKGLFQFRVGDYRIIYAMAHAARRIIVLHVKHREDAYRVLSE